MRSILLHIAQMASTSKNGPSDMAGGFLVGQARDGLLALSSDQV